jgi:hypothetical protein
MAGDMGHSCQGLSPLTTPEHTYIVPPGDPNVCLAYRLGAAALRHYRRWTRPPLKVPRAWRGARSGHDRTRHKCSSPMSLMLMGFSRIHLGVRYLSDVIAGLRNRRFLGSVGAHALWVPLNGKFLWTSNKDFGLRARKTLRTNIGISIRSGVSLIPCPPKHTPC